MSVSPQPVGVLGASHIHLCDPHETGRQRRHRQPTALTPKPTGLERLSRWFKRHGALPSHIATRPISRQLTDKVAEANDFDTKWIWLDADNQWHLGSLEGAIIAHGDTLA